MRLTHSQQQIYQRKLAIANAVHKVPLEYQQKQRHCYPSDNFHEFERWFRDNTTATELAGKERCYLPILWTAYWCNNGYGQKGKWKGVLQNYVNSLPRNKKYFTICQYDDGCMVDFKDLDIKIFGMSGGRIDYPIPLLCLPHKYDFTGIKKDIFCSFMGADTHPIRKRMAEILAGDNRVYITTKKQSLEEYCKLLARSVYVLAPRGYGKSSFRIVEALQYGAIPVYVSDEFVIPYNYTFPGIACTIDLLSDVLVKDTESIKQRIAEQKHLYTYSGCKQKILENI